MSQIRFRNENERFERAKRLGVLVDEAKRRGLPIPEVDREVRFPIDSNGYFVRMDGRQFNLDNSSSIEFINSTSVLTALISGRGGSKSASGSQKALKKISMGESGAVLNPDFENFKISTWPEFREWIPWEMVVPKHRYRGADDWEPYQPFRLNFMNGAWVLCKGLKDADSARGPNINWLWYDEAGRDPDGLAWQIALASVRIGDDIQAWITTTPKGRSHWIYKFFVNQDIPEDALEEFEKMGGDREFIEMYHTSIWENKENLNPAFFANMLLAYPKGWLRQQELEGKFVDSGGVIGDRAWFNGRIVPLPPDTVSGRVRYWDLAATEKKMIPGKRRVDPDETVGTKLSWVKGSINPGDKAIGSFCIEHQVCGFWKWDDVKATIVATAEMDGPYIPIYVEQEPGSGGKNQVAELQSHIKRMLGTQYKVTGHRPEGDRVLIANTWFSEAANGQFYMVQGNWNAGCLDQLDTFGDPNAHDDRITSISGARYCLAPIKTWKEIKFMSI